MKNWKNCVNKPTKATKSDRLCWLISTYFNSQHIKDSHFFIWFDFIWLNQQCGNHSTPYIVKSHQVELKSSSIAFPGYDESEREGEWSEIMLQCTVTYNVKDLLCAVEFPWRRPIELIAPRYSERHERNTAPHRTKIYLSSSMRSFITLHLLFKCHTQIQYKFAQKSKYFYLNSLQFYYFEFKLMALLVSPTETCSIQM